MGLFATVNHHFVHRVDAPVLVRRQLPRITPANQLSVGCKEANPESISHQDPRASRCTQGLSTDRRPASGVHWRTRNSIINGLVGSLLPGRMAAEPRTRHVRFSKRTFIFSELPFSEETQSTHAEREDGWNIVRCRKE